MKRSGSALFETFEGFIDHLLLHDLLDGGRVRFAMPFDDFVMPSVLQVLATYRGYMETSMEFIHARNARIAAYARSGLVTVRKALSEITPV